MQKETTSGKKIAKKVRQQYNREIKKTVEENVYHFADAFRPRPKWIPKMIWRKIVNRVVDISVLLKQK